MRLRFYSNENFHLGAVEQLRSLGYDVLTSLEAGRANQRISDEQVLEFARQESRAVLTFNRLHFVRLHKRQRSITASLFVRNIQIFKHWP